MTSAAEKVRDEIVGHQTELLRGEAAIKIEVDRILRRFGIAAAKTVVAEDGRVSFVIRSLGPEIESVKAELDALIESEGRAAYLSSGQATLREINNAVPGIIEVTLGRGAATFGPIKNKKAMERALRGPIMGEWRKRMVNEWGTDTLKRVRNALVEGQQAGDNLSDIVRVIRGRRENGFKDGIVALKTRHAQAIARTMLNHAANEGRNDALDQASTVVKGVSWASTLDLRTSTICRALDGATWYRQSDGSYRAVAGSPPWRGPPPAHWGCRSTLVPVLKGWDELTTNPKIAEKLRRAKRGKGFPEELRQSLDGEVPSHVTYDEWLKTRTITEQKEVLGATKWQLWSEGKLSMRDMIDQSHRPLLVSELERKAG